MLNTKPEKRRLHKRNVAYHQEGRTAPSYDEEGYEWSMLWISQREHVRCEVIFAQSAGAVEYTECTSAEG